MKSLKFLLTTIGILILNYISFDKIDSPFIHVLQFIVGIVGMVLFSLTMINLGKRPYYKKYVIPMFLGLIIVGRITESLFSAFIEKYYPNLYDKFPNAPFAFVILLLLIIGTIILLPMIIDKIINKSKEA